MLPARMVGNPAVFKMCSIKEVVVVFPFDPVIPMIRPLRKRLASSISLQTVTPFERADCNSGESAGTPGLGMIKSAPCTNSWRWPPSSRATPTFRNSATAAPSSLSERASVAATRAPRAAQNNAVDTPVLARPTTSTRLFRSSIDADIPIPKLLPQFQSRQRKQCKHQGGNPEADDHLRLAPAQQFEMVMNRRHAENALAPQLERTHLQNDRERFQDKYSADEEKQDLLLDDDGDGPKGAPQRQRADVSHENFRRMRVVPEESQRCAYQRPAKNRELADSGDVLNIEIGGPAKIAADIGKDGES